VLFAVLLFSDHLSW